MKSLSPDWYIGAATRLRSGAIYRAFLRPAPIWVHNWRDESRRYEDIVALSWQARGFP